MADDDPTRRLDPGHNSTRRLDPDDFATVRGLSAGRTVFGRYVLENSVFLLWERASLMNKLVRFRRLTRQRIQRHTRQHR